jgi:hypothetical protein
MIRLSPVDSSFPHLQIVGYYNTTNRLDTVSTFFVKRNILKLQLQHLLDTHHRTPLHVRCR